MKKLLEGLLKKKEKDKDKNEESKEPQDDVPDELPPLAEDIVDKPADSKSEDQKEGEETPGELPSLDLKKNENKNPDEASPEEKKQEEPTTPEKEEESEVKKIEEPAEEKDQKEETQNIQKKSETSDKEKKEETIPEDEASTTIQNEKILQTEEISKIGFFSGIIDHINKNKGSKEKLLSGNLFSRMNNYWELKKHEIRSGAVASSESKLDQNLKKKLEELKVLENKWQVQRMALEEDLRFLHERELEIQNKISELNKISNEMLLFKNVKPDKYFCLYNGVVLKSLHDLINILEVIDDETFNHHVNEHKNDFAHWIKTSIKDKHIAYKIKDSKTRQKMIEILETEPIVFESLKSRYKKEVPPQKYFWLENGVVVKSLYELSDALKTMEPELFSKHVNKGKNDISDWIKNKLKITELGEKLSNVNTKKDMVDILEVYL